MSLYTIDTDQAASDLLPPKKRAAGPLALLRSLLKPMQRNADIYFTASREGSSYPAYSVGSYALGDIVAYNYGLYEAIVDGTSQPPEDATQWRKLSSTTIGTDQSQHFSGSKLILEYALNAQFGTNFAQPPSQSDIYIDLAGVGISPFRVGDTESISSTVGDAISSEFVYDGYTIGPVINFTIMVPLVVYTGLGADADNIISEFVDRYIPTSINYTIATY